MNELRCWRCGCEINDPEQRTCDECEAVLVLPQLEDENVFDADELGVDPFPED